MPRHPSSFDSKGVSELRVIILIAVVLVFMLPVLLWFIGEFVGLWDVIGDAIQ